MSEVRKLSTIIFADIKGYTQLMQKDEEYGLVLLNRFKEILQSTVQLHNGRIVQFFGDACLLSFDSASDGARTSIQLQNLFREKDVPVRMGIHIGDVVFKEENAFGDGVNIASRIESIGIPGAVLISKNVRDHIKSKTEFDIHPLGTFEFKNVEEEIDVYALANEGLVVPTRDELEGKGKAISGSIWNSTYTIPALAIGAVVILALWQFAGNIDFINTKEAQTGIISENLAIGVLPLYNLNSKSENLEFFSDGVTQEIIDELSQVRALTMIAFTSTIRYKNSDKLNSTIADELNVNYLMSGTSRIYSNGDSVKISLELIDPKNNDQRIWNNTYVEPMKNAPGIQNKIARHVAQSLDIELTSEEDVLLDQLNTTSGEAYRLFLLARSEFFKLSKEGFARSIEILHQVVELDPNFAQAQTFLAWAYNLASNPWFDGHINKPINELNEIIDPIVEKSLKLDPSNSDLFLVRGHQSAFIDGQLIKAKEDVDHALEMNSWPLVPTTYCMCIVVSTYVALDDIAPAADLIEMARKLDPGSVFIEWDAANVMMKQGRFKEAQALYEDAAKTAPVSMFKSFLGWNYYHTGEYEKAKDQLLKTYKESELPITLNVAYLSNTYYELGNMAESDRFLNELIQRDESGEYHVNLYIATAYLGRGDKSRALDYLEMAWEQRNWGMALFINLDPLFKVLYDEPRFKQIRKEMQFYIKD